jgi:hypothetical protein
MLAIRVLLCSGGSVLIAVKAATGRCELVNVNNPVPIPMETAEKVSRTFAGTLVLTNDSTEAPSDTDQLRVDNACVLLGYVMGTIT